MASISAKLLHFITAILSLSFPVAFPATVVEDLNNLHPPPDFNSTIQKNCKINHFLRYCNATPFDLHEIFKSTIVASHLCNISNNPNCVESFPNIDLHSQPKIAPLYLSFTFFWKYCPLTILSIDLSNNSLEGSFPGDIFYCSQIQGLDLSHNNLSGDVPVHNFSLLENLTFLNLSYNDFSECRISDTHFFEHFNASSFIHSGLLPNNGVIKIRAVFLLVGFPVLVIVTVVCLGWILRSKHRFTPAMIKTATNGFSKRNLAGNNVYRGFLRDGSAVRIEIYADSVTRENRRRFLEQCKILVQLDHKNVVPVLGWCDSRKFRAVVTEWVDGVDIETWLSTSAPPWEERIQLILGIAAGICYLHEEWPEIGYNLKTRNLMLSEDGEPLITRFTLDGHHGSTRKAFGVFILEMITNRRPTEDFETKEAGFVQWVKLHYPDDLYNVIDKRMKTYNIEIVSEVIEFGLMCTDLSSSGRPSWDKICALLSDLSQESFVDRGKGHKHVHHRGV